MSTGLCNRKSVNFKLLVEFVEKQKGLKSPKTGLRTNLTDKSGSPPRPAATPLYLAVVPGTFMPCIFAPECRINMLTLQSSLAKPTGVHFYRVGRERGPQLTSSSSRYGSNQSHIMAGGRVNRRYMKPIPRMYGESQWLSRQRTCFLVSLRV